MIQYGPKTTNLFPDAKKKVCPNKIILWCQKAILKQHCDLAKYG